MAQFRGTIEGQRGQASRLGSAKSGLSATVNGWHTGIRVQAFHENGKDRFRVTLTGGSTNPSRTRVLGCFDHEDLEVLAPEKKAV